VLNDCDGYGRIAPPVFAADDVGSALTAPPPDFDNMSTAPTATAISRTAPATIHGIRLRFRGATSCGVSGPPGAASR